MVLAHNIFALLNITSSEYTFLPNVPHFPLNKDVEIFRVDNAYNSTVPIGKYIDIEWVSQENITLLEYYNIVKGNRLYRASSSFHAVYSVEHLINEPSIKNASWIYSIPVYTRCNTRDNKIHYTECASWVNGCQAKGNNLNYTSTLCGCSSHLGINAGLKCSISSSSDCSSNLANLTPGIGPWPSEYVADCYVDIESPEHNPGLGKSFHIQNTGRYVLINTNIQQVFPSETCSSNDNTLIGCGLYPGNFEAPNGPWTNCQHTGVIYPTQNGIYDLDMCEKRDIRNDLDIRLGLNDDALYRDIEFALEWYSASCGLSCNKFGAGNDTQVMVAWNHSSGRNVVIGILDDGLYDSTDLNVNESITYFTNTVPGTHGSGCAAIAAGSNNNIGSIGIAYNSQITSLDILSGTGDCGIYIEALSYGSTHIYVKSNSWGEPDTYDHQLSKLNRLCPTIFSEIEYQATYGRNNLGTIFVWANGNGGILQNSNFDSLANSIYTFSVQAISWQGNKIISISERGDNILVSAVSSTGYGYHPRQNSGNQWFSATSGAAPVISGVIALILEVNPFLSRRDVEHILISSTYINDRLDKSWSQNQAGLWYSYFYGFGAINATKAVERAMDWFPVTESVNFVHNIDVNTNIINSWTYSFYVNRNIKLEHTNIQLNMYHPFINQLQIELTSPMNTTGYLVFNNNDNARYNQYTDNTYRDVSQSISHRLDNVRFWDEGSQGNWTISMSNLNTVQGIVTLNSLEFVFYGTDFPNPPSSPSPPFAPPPLPTFPPSPLPPHQPPPPRFPADGFTTAKAKATAIAASIAFPPSSKTFIPISVAR